MNNRDLMSFSVSLGLHALVFAIVLSLGPHGMFKGGDGDSDKGGRAKYKGVDASGVIEKERPIAIEVVEPVIKAPGIKKKKPKPQRKNADTECPGKWYGGIGIQNKSHPLGEEIEKIFSGYPADLAGLQIGDVITSVVGNEITGPPGTPVHMIIMRNGQFIKLTIIRGKVCYGG